MVMSEKQKNLLKTFMQEMQKAKLTIAEAEEMHMLLYRKTQKVLEEQKKNNVFFLEEIGSHIAIPKDSGLKETNSKDEILKKIQKRQKN